MPRIVNNAETFTTVYEAFQNVNFSAFDFNTIKQSLIDYIKLYFPEDFNDWIESSEFVAILELFAYVGELIAYRADVNAQENFITTAQRKDSILRLVKLIAYKATRNLPARGLIKINSISTTEHVIDSNGLDLVNRTINWSDTSNIFWKDQFLLVLNRVLEQPFGTVLPQNRVQIDDVLFELYSFNNQPLNNGVIRYSTIVAGQTYPMELVSTALDPVTGIYEKRPEANAAFSILYGSDGLGDTSPTTGFFIFTKQGSLQKFTTTFDGVTPNQTYDVATVNINETDVWINNVDPVTDITVDDGSVPGMKSGDWVQVDITHAQNIVFNTNTNRNKYEIETLDNDQIRLIFGDGEFANIPSGTFDIWVRASANIDLVIPQNSVINETGTFSYLDTNGNPQTLTFTFSLVNSLLNASPSEDIEHIRQTAPSVYYTQDRMVNGRDYNTFMLQDPSILKLRAVNRTFAGDSKYIAWHDPKESYENVKIFGDDLLLYFKTGTTFTSVNNVSDVSTLILNYIQPLLSSNDIYLSLIKQGVLAENIRTSFNSSETASLGGFLSTVAPGGTVTLAFNNLGQWISAVGSANPPITLIWVEKSATVSNAWTVNHFTNRMIAESQTTNFWNTNDSNTIINFDTINSLSDSIVLLKANPNNTRTSLFPTNQNLVVLGQEDIEPGQPDAGLPNIHQLSVLPADSNGDNIADNLTLSGILNPTITVTSTGIITLPIYYIVGSGDTSIVGNGLSIIAVTPGINGTFSVVGNYTAFFAATNTFTVLNSSGNDGTWTVLSSAFSAGNTVITVTGTIPSNTVNGSIVPITVPPVAPTFIEVGTANTPSNQVNVTSLGTNSSVTVTVNDYVYFKRLSTVDQWIPQLATVENINLFIDDGVFYLSSPQNRLWRRFNGRDQFNFAWLHTAAQYHLIDPAASNIIDIFIINRGYFTEIRQWLDGILPTQPEQPTPLDLRTSYNYLLGNAMISDTVVLHAGSFKILFGAHAIPELQAKIKIIKSPTSILTDNQIKTTIMSTVLDFFDVNKWEFSETFYFSELSTAIHNALPSDISLAVLVPIFANNHFGDLFQIIAGENEIFQPDITVNDIEIVQSVNAQILRQNSP